MKKSLALIGACAAFVACSSSDSGSSGGTSASSSSSSGGSSSSSSGGAKDAGSDGSAGGALPALTGNPSVSTTSVAIGATITLTAPVNENTDEMTIYLGCLQNPSVNRATVYSEGSGSKETATATKAAGATTIAATLTIPDDSLLKQDRNQKCRFGIQLKKVQSAANNSVSYTWVQMPGTGKLPTSDTKYVQINQPFNSPSTQTAAVSSFDIPFFTVTFP